MDLGSSAIADAAVQEFHLPDETFSLFGSPIYTTHLERNAYVSKVYLFVDYAMICRIAKYENSSTYMSTLFSLFFVTAHQHQQSRIELPVGATRSMQ